jgi:hypothetical protein
MKLISDFWVEGKNKETVIDDPSFTAITDAINALDGRNRTMISLTHSDKSCLLAAGPCNDGYLINATLDNTDFFSPKNSDSAPAQVSCFIGGQDGVYRADQFVAKEVAERAVGCFYKNVDLSPDIDWYSRNGRGPRLERE